MARGDSYQIQGQQGGIVLNVDEGAKDGPFRWVLVVNDAVLSAIDSNIQNDGDLVGLTLPAGSGFGGQINSLTVSSGTVIAYLQ